MNTYNPASELSSLLDSTAGFDDVSLAQYVEIKTLLSGYLLSSQGDRVAMAHSIEGRYPFLDHRVIEYCCKMPSTIRMRVLAEKYILKASMRDLIPPPILKRTKQPYMAPDAQSFFSKNAPSYVEDLLSEDSLLKTGYFNIKSVSALVNKCRKNPVLGFKDNMAVVGIISTLLLHDLFVENFDAKRGLTTKGVAEEDFHYVAVA